MNGITKWNELRELASSETGIPTSNTFRDAMLQQKSEINQIFYDRKVQFR